MLKHTHTHAHHVHAPWPSAPAARGWGPAVALAACVGRGWAKALGVCGKVWWRVYEGWTSAS